MHVSTSMIAWLAVAGVTFGVMALRARARRRYERKMADLNVRLHRLQGEITLLELMSEDPDDDEKGILADL